MSWTEWTESSFRGLKLTNLKVDGAFLNVSNALNKAFYLYTLSEECVNCPLRKIKEIAPNKETVIKLDVSRKLEMRLYDTDLGKFVVGNATKVETKFSTFPDFGEFGVYDLKIMPSSAIKLETAKEPVTVNTCKMISNDSLSYQLNSTFYFYLALALVALVLVAFYWLCKGINKFYLQKLSTENATEPTQQTGDDELDSAPRTKKRLKSLDIFRGIAIVLMIFVNSGGGHYWWIEHAVWNGLHFADLVFPWFLFIMGVCIPMSIKSQINQQISINEIVGKIVKVSLNLKTYGKMTEHLFLAINNSIRTWTFPQHRVRRNFRKHQNLWSSAAIWCSLLCCKLAAPCFRNNDSLR